MSEDDLHAALRTLVIEELDYRPGDADEVVAVAIRRWRSFQRRSRPNKRTPELRIRDLVQGFRQAWPDRLIYLEPGEYERLAESVAPALDAHDISPPDAG